MYKNILNELISLKDDKKRIILQRFFKTGKGQYGEGDIFLGINVPIQKKIAKKYYKLISLEDTIELLQNKYHECRLTALFILRFKFEKYEEQQNQIFNLYLDNTKYINNWDLVDSSASYIVGRYIYENNIDRNILYSLIDSNDLWKQRIAVISSMYFINNNDFNDILKMSELLLNHKHDLIHKATGWMLREVGKKDYNILYNFLNIHYKSMPRTMLRYSIERLKEEDKKYFMN